jgi:hypothetical protein
MTITKASITAALLAAASAAAILGTTGAASAAVHGQPVTAVTAIVNRADNGGGGQWASDTFTRTLQVIYLGKSTDPAHAAAPYMYQAQVSDTGTFRDLPGQLTPNQGGRNAGRVLRPGQVSGPMAGYGQWGVFYASNRAHDGLVPASLRGAVNASYPSATWPELAFPAGTAFTGVSEAAYGYDYQAVPFTRFVVKTVNGKHVIVKVTGFRQHWSDTAFNGDGQLPRDGNITGLR